MSRWKKLLSCVLASCLALTVCVSGALAYIGNTQLYSKTDASASASEGEKNIGEVHVSSAEELKKEVESDHSSVDQYIIYLDDDITMTAATLIDLDSWFNGKNSSPENIVIDGQTHTLAAPVGGNTEVINADYYDDSSLTFRNMTINANRGKFLCSDGAYSADFAFVDVVLENFYEDRSGTIVNPSIKIYGPSQSGVDGNSLTISRVETKDCEGALMYLGYMDHVTIEESTLSSVGLYSDSEILQIRDNYSSDYYDTVTIDGSTIYWEENENEPDVFPEYTLEVYGRYINLILTGGSKIYGYGNNSYAVYGRSSNVNLTMDECTIANNDNTSASVYLTGSSSNLYTDGRVQGEPTILLRTGSTGVSNLGLSGKLQYKLKYDFIDSLSSTSDYVVVQGADDYTLTEEDLTMLEYVGSADIPNHTLELDEENNQGVLCRPNIFRCEVELTIPDGWPTAEDVDSETGETVTIIEVTQNDTPAEPIVTLTLNGEVVDSSNYTVAYENNEFDAHQVHQTIIGKVILTPTASGELRGDPVEVEFPIRVGDLEELTAENTLISVSLEEIDGVYQYVSQVSYTYFYEPEDDEETSEGEWIVEELTEGRDYTIAYKINNSTYELTVTVTGMGGFYGTVSVTLPLLGQESMITSVRDEATLTEALANEVPYIYIENDFDVANSMVINYDCTINGQGFVISLADENSDPDFIFTVTEANVTLTNLTVDGGGTASALSVGERANVTVNDGSVLQNGNNRSNMYSGVMNGTILYIADGGTLTLQDCTVRNAGIVDSDVAYGYIKYPIYIETGGTLTVENGTYLTGLYSSRNAVQNRGTLNWTGGVFDVNNTVGAFANSTEGSAGSVIDNRGLFNMSGGTINGFLMDDNGSFTQTRSTAYAGTIINEQDAEFNMSGGTITGMNAAGNNNSSGAGYFPSGGGGVYNCGTFTMTGGTITGNSSIYEQSEDHVANQDNSGGSGGGVYNGGVFYMMGGTISDNTANIGGGVYNDNARGYSGAGGGQSTHEYNEDIAAGEFYMTGGEISGNHLSGSSITGQTQEGDRMGQDNQFSISNVGSELYVSGGSTVEISGNAVIRDDTDVSVTVTSSEGEESTEKINVGIAVAPVLSETRGATGSSFQATVQANGTMTVTGSPTIDAGVVLVNHVSSTIYAEVLNLGSDEFDASDWDTYELRYTGEESTITSTSWLTLDGGLKTSLTVNTLDSYTSTIQVTNIQSTAGTDYITSQSERQYRINSDGDPVAVYNDRVTPRESDEDLLKTGAGLYLTTLTIVDEDSSEATYDAWIICRHTDLYHVDALAATCTTDGNIDCYRCPICGAYFDIRNGELVMISDDEAILPATGHENVSRSAYLAPTCTEAGHEACYECEACGELFTDLDATQPVDESYILPALGHDPILVEGYPADCAAGTTGLTTGIACSRCDTVFLEQMIIEITHDLCEMEDSDGTIYWICAVCGNCYADENAETIYYPETYPETGDHVHDWVLVNGQAPTCTEEGWSDSYYCSKCSEEIIPVTIAPTGHALYGQAAVAATCTEPGHIAYYECLNCQKLFSDTSATQELSEDEIVIAAAGHTLTKIAAKDATATTAGNIEYYKCGVCGKLFSDSSASVELTESGVTIPATGGVIIGSGSTTVVGSSDSSGSSSGSDSSDSSSSGTTVSGGSVVYVTGSSGSSSGSTVSSGSSSGTTIVRGSSSDDDDEDEESEEDEEELEESEEEAELEEATAEAILNYGMQNLTGRAASWDFDQDDLLSDYDRMLMDLGYDISFDLSVSDLEEGDLGQNVLDAIAEVAAMQGSLLGIRYLDITLTESVEGMDSEVSTIAQPVDITLEVPTDLTDAVSDAENGLWMIRVHDGVATLLEAEYDESAGTVTFSTDRFSTYALVALGPFAEEEADAEEPVLLDETEPLPVEEEEESGGLNWVIWLIIAIIVVVVIVALIFIFNPKARAAFKRSK